jgi:hypothetical protein
MQSRDIDHYIYFAALSSLAIVPVILSSLILEQPKSVKFDLIRSLDLNYLKYIDTPDAVMAASLVAASLAFFPARLIPVLDRRISDEDFYASFSSHNTEIGLSLAALGIAFINTYFFTDIPQELKTLSQLAIYPNAVTFSLIHNQTPSALFSFSASVVSLSLLGDLAGLSPWNSIIVSLLASSILSFAEIPNQNTLISSYARNYQKNISIGTMVSVVLGLLTSAIANPDPAFATSLIARNLAATSVLSVFASGLLFKPKPSLPVTAVHDTAGCTKVTCTKK